MRMMINKGFAKEKEDNIEKKCGCDCTCCQKRHSQYWIDKKGARTAAEQYTSSHLRLTGEKLQEFLSFRFDEKWEAFDVLKKGEIEIEQMSPFLKQVMGDMTIPIQWSNKDGYWYITNNYL